MWKPPVFNPDAPPFFKWWCLWLPAQELGLSNHQPQWDCRNGFAKNYTGSGMSESAPTDPYDGSQLTKWTRLQRVFSRSCVRALWDWAAWCNWCASPGVLSIAGKRHYVWATPRKLHPVLSPWSAAHPLWEGRRKCSQGALKKPVYCSYFFLKTISVVQ